MEKYEASPIPEGAGSWCRELAFNARNESARLSRSFWPGFNGTNEPVEPGSTARCSFILTTLDRCGESPSPSGSRKTSYLPLHGGRPLAPGNVRLQTAACQIARAADAGIVYQRSAGGTASRTGTGVL